MGQKVHPYGFRLGINTGWKSRWYVNPREYADTLNEDLILRKTLLSCSEAKSADIGDVEIVRKPQKITVLIHTARPGVIIGSKGANIEKIQKILQKKSSKTLNIKIKEIKKPDTNAQVVALGIARQLKGKGAFRRVLKMAMQNAMRGGIQGIKIKISGRLGGAEMSRSLVLKEGRIPLHTLRAKIDYGFAESMTTYGVIGVKVWMFHGEVYKSDTKDDAGSIVKRPSNMQKSGGASL